MTNQTAELSLIDLEDQGVCPDGHDCELIVNREGDLARACTKASHDYVGWPLINPDITEGDITAAEQAGADPDLVFWARASLADRS